MSYDPRGADWDWDPHVAPEYRRPVDPRGAWRPSDDGPPDDPDQEATEAQIEAGRRRKPWGWER